MAANTLGLNQVFPIYNQDGTPFNDMVLHKASVNSVVMSLGDKITGEAYYHNNSLNLTMLEYIVYNGVKYTLVNPPTIIREGLTKDNSELKGMTKYSFEFYHPMYQLGNIPFCDVAVSIDQTRYLSENKTFSWIGKPQDFIDKLNKNLQGTQWIVEKSTAFPAEKEDELSDVLTFDKNMISDALKTFHDTWDVPYIVDVVDSSESSYASGKRFKVVIGLPVTEIYASESDRQLGTPFVFRMGQGIGLKNNSRNPRNNKIITRLAGYGSEKNIPYGYPQIVWDGSEDDPRLRYPLYDGIVGGRYVKLIQHPFTRNHLMPSVYTDAVNKKVNPNATGYNPNIELKDYYDAVGGDYPNQINPLAPSYEIHEFEDINPEMNDGTSNVEILGAIPLNADLTPASEWVDDIDSDGNFVQSFFQITLPQLSFDLYACAAITQEMQINMRSGDCIGCTFPIQVDWDDYKRNFYDDNGDFAPDGSQRDLSKYPKSNLGSIDVVVQKENSTFGTIMPSIYQQPQSGDEFVILGISLPLEYITSAEQRLDEAMQSFLLENNIYYYDYPLKFDEHFLTTHTYILSQIKPNAILRFQYAGQVLGLYVKQLTIKYGNGVLPEYDITLTDNVDVVLNQIGQVAEDVEKLSSVLSILRQSYNRNVWTELAKKLSKVSDDTAQGFIRFIQGLQVGDQFVSGLLGEGAVFRKEADGTTYMEADKLYIRMKAYFDTVVIREYRHEVGNRVASVAGAKCVRVAWYNSSNVELEQTAANLSSVAYFRCFFRASDGQDTVRNDFIVGDQVYCHITSVETSSDNPEQKGLNMKHYWRLCIGRNVEGTLTENGEAWIDISNRTSETLTIGGTSYTHAGYQTGSDVPAPQDSMIQLGCISDTDRQGAIIEYVTGANAPAYQIYQGINDFSLNGKSKIIIGYNSQTGHAEMKVYGDAYIGDPNGTTYIEYKQDDGTQQHNPVLNIKARINASSTIGNQSLPDYIKANQKTYDAAIAELVTTTEDLQSQIDGAIDTWYFDYMPVAESQGAPVDRVPLTNVEPYKTWYQADNGGTAQETTTERTKHLGDIFYDNSTGYAFRFSLNENTSAFEWVVITDSAVIEALERASHAQETADGKMSIYSVWNAWMKDNVNTLKMGDLFIPTQDTTPTGSSTTYYKDKVYKCLADGTSSFREIDYTDDRALIDFVTNTYATDLQNLNTQIDKKAETWYQSTDPSSAWTTAALRTEHIGDIWHNTSPSTVAGVESERDAIWNGTSWEMSDVPQSVYDKIDGKADIFVSKPSTYNEFDLWIIESGLSSTDMPTGCVAGDIVIADNMPSGTTKRTNSYTKGDWRKKDRYTDDSAFNGYINAIVNGSGSSGDAAVAAAAQRAITSALGGATVVDGGLMLTSLIGMRKYKGTGSVTDIANYDTWAGISGEYDANLTGGGIAAWYGGGMKDYETLSAAQKANGWSVERWAKSLLRFDGSGYLANDNIRWNANGIVTIANVYADVNGTNVLLSSSLQDIANLSNAFPLTIISGVTYLDPQYGFSNLSVLGNSVITTAGGTITGTLVLSKTTDAETGSYTSPALVVGGTSTQAHLELDANEIIAKSGASTFTNLWLNDVVYVSTDSLIVPSGKKLQIGDAVLSWDATNQGIKITKGLYSETFISALGAGTDQGGGGDVTWALLADNTDTRQIAMSHLTNVLSTLTGYTASGKYYAVQKDSSNHLYVYVPWESGGGGTGTVTSIKLGSSGTTYTPTNGLITLPAYPTVPTSVSAFTNDSGYITSSGSCSYATSAGSAGSVAWSNVSGRPTALSSFTNDSGYITSSALSGYATQTWVGQNYLPLTGGTLTGGLQVNGRLFAYNYGSLGGNNVAAIVFDKPNSYNTGIGAHSSNDTIWFGACDTNGGWIDSYKQIWDFNGTIKQEGNAVIHAGNIGSQSVNYATSAGTSEWANNFLTNTSSLGGDSCYDTRSGFHAWRYNGDNNTIGGTDGLILQWSWATGSVGGQLYFDDNPTGIIGYRGCTGSSNGTTPNGFTAWMRLYSDWYHPNADYATSADTVDGYHESAFLHKSGGTVTDTFNVSAYGITVSYAPLNGSFAHIYQSGGVDFIFNASVYCMGGFYDYTTGNSWIHTGNIGSQSVNYANSAGNGIFTDTNTLGDNVNFNSITYALASRLTIEPIHVPNYSGQLNAPFNGYGTLITFNDGNTLFPFQIAHDNNSALYYRDGGYKTSDFTISSAWRQIAIFDSSGNLYVSGNLGVGTSANYKLHVNGTFKAENLVIELSNEINSYASNNGLHLNYRVRGDVMMCYGGGQAIVYGSCLQIQKSSEPCLYFHSPGVTHANIRMKSNGEIYFYAGTSNAQADAICVNAGEFYSYGQVVALSDERDKNVVGNVGLSVEQIADAPAVRFLWKDGRADKTMQTGSIAQYWQKVLPEVIREKEDRLSLSYGVAALVSTIITARKVVDHEKRIAELERERIRD